MHVTKPYQISGVGAMHVTNPYNFSGFGAMYYTPPQNFFVGPRGPARRGSVSWPRGLGITSPRTFSVVGPGGPGGEYSYYEAAFK